MANIDTAIRLSGVAEFNSSVKTVKGELRNLKNEMIYVTEEFRNNADSSEALQAKQKILSDQISKTQQIVSEAETYLKKYTDESGAGSESTIKMANTLNLAKAALSGLNNELAENYGFCHIKYFPIGSRV